MWCARQIYGILGGMSSLSPDQVEKIYQNFRAPIAELNCGEKCAPYNERGVPFCCDTRHVIPAAYLEEWDFLQERTDLWHRWEAQDKKLQARFGKAAPPELCPDRLPGSSSGARGNTALLPAGHFLFSPT